MDWKEKYGGLIIKQLKSLVLLVIRIERFTMDEGSNKAVIEAFIHLYKDIFIRIKIIIVPVCETTISDASRA